MDSQMEGLNLIKTNKSSRLRYMVSLAPPNSKGCAYWCYFIERRRERRPRRYAKSVAPSRAGTTIPERTATPVQKEVATVALSSRVGLGVSDHRPAARSRVVARAPESSQPT